VLGLLELLEQVAPLIGAHGGRPIETLLPHLGGYLLPEVLVGLGSVEERVHLAAEANERARLVLHPRLRPLLGGFDLHLGVLSAALAEDHRRRVVRRRRREVAVGDDLDHHVARAFLLVEVDWARLLRQVHGWVSSLL